MVSKKKHFQPKLTSQISRKFKGQKGTNLKPYIVNLQFYNWTHYISFPLTLANVILSRKIAIGYHEEDLI